MTWQQCFDLIGWWGPLSCLASLFMLTGFGFEDSTDRNSLQGRLLCASDAVVGVASTIPYLAFATRAWSACSSHVWTQTQLDLSCGNMPLTRASLFLQCCTINSPCTHIRQFCPGSLQGLLTFYCHTSHSCACTLLHTLLLSCAVAVAYCTMSAVPFTAVVLKTLPCMAWTTRVCSSSTDTARRPLALASNANSVARGVCWGRGV